MLCCLRPSISLQQKAFSNLWDMQWQTLRTLCKCQTHYQAEEGRVLIELFLQPFALHSHNRTACVIMAFLHGSDWKKQIISKEMFGQE